MYRLLVETYKANEEIRDYSGHTPSYYLENNIQVNLVLQIYIGVDTLLPTT